MKIEIKNTEIKEDISLPCLLINKTNNQIIYAREISRLHNGSNYYSGYKIEESELGKWETDFDKSKFGKYNGKLVLSND